VIVVVADDLAGAAEIGGVAFRYGLNALVQSDLERCPLADLLVIDTDSRSCPAGEADRRVARAAALCGGPAVRLVFKKVDSVLRGPVLAELGALLAATDRERALLVPANPRLGRTIVGGRYYVRGVPLHETDFARDPEYPATTADVLDLLGPDIELPRCVLRPGDPLPGRGVIVGEAANAIDLDTWARAVDDRTLPAGAAEFFEAFLRAFGFERVDRSSDVVTPGADDVALFVCGSTFERSHAFCLECEKNGIPVIRMPLALLDAASDAGTLVHVWVVQGVQALETHRRVVLAIDRPLCRQPEAPQRLSAHLGAAVEAILATRHVDHVFVEGGATAVALIRRFGWRQLRVRHEFAPGVVCLQVEGISAPLLTMKPGSYAWPRSIRTC